MISFQNPVGVSMSIFGDICHAYSGGKSTPTPIQTTTNYSSTRLPMLWRRNPDAVPDLFKQYESSLLVHEFQETNKVDSLGVWGIGWRRGRVEEGGGGGEGNAEGKIKTISDVIKQNESELPNTVCKIRPNKTDSLFCFLLFV